MEFNREAKAANAPVKLQYSVLIKLGFHSPPSSAVSNTVSAALDLLGGLSDQVVPNKALKCAWRHLGRGQSQSQSQGYVEVWVRG